MICFTSSLIRQLYHFATDFDRVLLQLVGTDAENNRVNIREAEHGDWIAFETGEVGAGPAKSSRFFVRDEHQLTR